MSGCFHIFQHGAESLRRGWWLDPYFLVLWWPAASGEPHPFQSPKQPPRSPAVLSMGCILWMKVVSPCSGLKAPWVCSPLDIFSVSGVLHIFWWPSHPFKNTGNLGQPLALYVMPSFLPHCWYRTVEASLQLPCTSSIKQSTGPSHSQISKLTRIFLHISSRHTYTCELADVGRILKGCTISVLHLTF